MPHSLKFGKTSYAKFLLGGIQQLHGQLMGDKIENEIIELLNFIVIRNLRCAQIYPTIMLIKTRYMLMLKGERCFFFHVEKRGGGM